MDFIVAFLFIIKSGESMYDPERFHEFFLTLNYDFMDLFYETYNKATERNQ